MPKENKTVVTSPVPRNPAPSNDTNIERMRGEAEHFLAFIKTLDAGYALKIDALFEERKCDAFQAVCSMVIRTLDADEHLIMPMDHPFFNGDMVLPVGVERDCAECGKPFMPKYSTMRLCGNSCADTFYKRDSAEQARRLAGEAQQVNV